MTELKRQIDQATMRDGLLDIVVGAGLVIFGTVFFTAPGLTPFSAVVFLLLIPVLNGLKERYVHPRAGYVKLIEDGEKEVKGIAATAALSVMALALTLTVMVLLKGAEPGKNVFMRWVFPGAASVLFSMGPLYLGQRYGLKRGYVLAFLTIFCGGVLTVTGVFTGYRAVGFVCLVAGGFLLTAGIILFTGFLRNNPLPEEAHD